MSTPWITNNRHGRRTNNTSGKFSNLHLLSQVELSQLINLLVGLYQLLLQFEASLEGVLVAVASEPFLYLITVLLVYLELMDIVHLVSLHLHHELSYPLILLPQFANQSIHSRSVIFSIGLSSKVLEHSLVILSLLLGVFKSKLSLSESDQVIGVC